MCLNFSSLHHLICFLPEVNRQFFDACFHSGSVNCLKDSKFNQNYQCSVLKCLKIGALSHFKSIKKIDLKMKGISRKDLLNFLEFISGLKLVSVANGIYVNF